MTPTTSVAARPRSIRTSISAFVHGVRRLDPLRGIHPLLFGVYPILFLWSQNVGEVGAADVEDAFRRAIPILLVATALFWVIFRDRRRGALIVTPAALGFLLFGQVARLHVPAEIETAAWVAIMAIALVAAIKLSKAWLVRLDTALLRVAAILVAVSLVSIVPTEVEEVLGARPVPTFNGGLPTVTTAQKRDVYWLVFDRYGSDRSLQLQYGVANPLTPWLRERGFEVLSDSHANYVGTAQSLATTLNMTPLDRLVRGVPATSPNYAPTYAAIQSSRVVRQFKALGYRYLHLGSWWNPTRIDSAADQNYNADIVPDFTSVMIETSVLPNAIKALGIDETPPTESAKHLKYNSYALDTLDSLPGQDGPKFVVAHVLLPHPPYVFDRDGRYIAPDEAATLDPGDAWHRQLDYTNSRLRTFLEGLLALPEDRQPIIVLQADEGPWPDRYAADKVGFDWQRASRDELDIKFGIMNAWYVPGGADLQLSQSLTAINTFPVLFDRYFGLDYPLLPDRVTTSRSWTQPYQLIDITTRLSSPH